MSGTLVGHYSFQVDDKNRLFIPVKHREHLGDSFMITHLYDNCISVYSMDEWEKLTQKISSLPQIQTRDIIRFLYSSAVEVQTDKQGRIVLPAELIEYAEIKKTAVIVGVGNHVEIWSDKNWEAKKEELTSANLLDMLKELGF